MNYDVHIIRGCNTQPKCTNKLRGGGGEDDDKDDDHII